MFKQKDLDKVKRAVLRKYDIAAGVALDGLDIKISDKIETACVVGKRDEQGVLQVQEILVNPNFFENLTFAERVFVLAHEVFHIALRHFSRAMDMPEKDAERKYKEYCEREQDENKRKAMKSVYLKHYHELWNIATDACINAFLKKDGLAFPENARDPKTGEKMTFVEMEEGFYQSAEKIYQYLIQKEEEKENKQNSDSPREKNQAQSSGHTSLDDVLSGDYTGIDSHEEWGGDDDKSKSPQPKDEKDAKDDSMAEKDLFDKIKESRETAKKSQESVSKTLGKIRTDAGTLDTKSVKPIFSWKALLVGYLEKTKEVWGMRRASRYNPNPRIEERTYEELPNVEVLLDTSGSISPELLRGFLLQLVPIFQTLSGEEVSIKVGCFGSNFFGFTTIRSIEDIKKFRPIAGGGTDFEVAATSFTPDPGRTCTKIVFTDGCLGTEQKTKVDNIIWVVFGNSMDFHPVSGRIIRVSKKDYDSMIQDGQHFTPDEENSYGRRR